MKKTRWIDNNATEKRFIPVRGRRRAPDTGAQASPGTRLTTLHGIATLTALTWILAACPLADSTSSRIRDRVWNATEPEVARFRTNPSVVRDRHVFLDIRGASSDRYSRFSSFFRHRSRRCIRDWRLFELCGARVKRQRSGSPYFANLSEEQVSCILGQRAIRT